MYRVTIDFEDCTVSWETDNQRTTEYYPGLGELKDAIIAALGFKVVDMGAVANAVNDYLNGRITWEEFSAALEREKDENPEEKRKD